MTDMPLVAEISWKRCDSTMSSLSHVSWSSTPEKIEDIYLNDAAEEGVTDETVIGRCIYRSGKERERAEKSDWDLFLTRDRIRFPSFVVGLYCRNLKLAWG